MVMMPGSVILSDRRNRLKASHLTMCARLFKDVLFTPSSFPYSEAIGVRYDAAAVRGRYMGGGAEKAKHHWLRQRPDRF